MLPRAQCPVMIAAMMAEETSACMLDISESTSVGLEQENERSLSGKRLRLVCLHKGYRVTWDPWKNRYRQHGPVQANCLSGVPIPRSFWPLGTNLHMDTGATRAILCIELRTSALALCTAYPKLSCWLLSPVSQQNLGHCGLLAIP